MLMQLVLTTKSLDGTTAVGPASSGAREVTIKVGIAGLRAPTTERLIDLLEMIGFQRFT